ncbi:hypothetical protein BKA56DRAFT_600729 [Ilyonectria sp. MPI-CAGE-AT-0026]|nr:hypothetical protein BKA56DRAFT_600729 [Ilyonectria sp. MPI-CAGE-AT-0026]
MASIPYRQIVGSSPFKFLIGPDKKEYTIHSSLVAHQSGALNALVNGGMKEAREKCAIWEEFDEETFLRFSQFAYTGNYDGAEPQKRKVEEQAPVLETAEEPNNIIASPLPSPVFDLSNISLPSPVFDLSKKDLLWNKFSNLYPGSEVKVAVHVNESDEDYTDVFISHAQMYVFADYHGIVVLQNLALRKLRQALMQYTLDEKGSRDIIQLVNYCFSNTADKEGQCDPLRTLVCTYTACKVEDLWKNDEFQELMDTLNEFPRALLTELLHRVD